MAGGPFGLGFEALQSQLLCINVVMLIAVLTWGISIWKTI